MKRRFILDTEEANKRSNENWIKRKPRKMGLKHPWKRQYRHEKP